MMRVKGMLGNLGSDSEKVNPKLWPVWLGRNESNKYILDIRIYIYM